MNHARAHEAVRRRQALFRAWGIPWYGRAKEAPAVALAAAERVMSEANDLATRALEQLPAVIEKPDAEKTPGELMTEALRDSLILGRDSVRYARRHLQTIEESGVLLYGEDLKVMRWGTDTAGWVARAAVRVVESEFRQRNSDVMVRLLEQIAAAKEEPVAIEGAADPVPTK